MSNRRQFLQCGALMAGGLMLNRTNWAQAVSVGVQHWGPYQQQLVIDGLCLGVGRLDQVSAQEAASMLDQFQTTGITAINETVTYPGSDFKTATRNVATRIRLCQEHANKLRMIWHAADIKQAKQHHQLGLIMGFQSTEMFAGDVDNIEVFADMGVRIMQMSYNNQGDLGAGCLVKNATGLTAMGATAVKRMEDLRVLIDLSHAHKTTVQETIALSKRPLTISHTGCNALYQHPRNNDDEDLKAVADRGGVVGIYLMPFLEGGEHEIKAERVIDHIEHAMNVCGVAHVGVGSDQGIIPVKDTPEYREAIRQEVLKRQQKGISAPGETPNRPPFIPELNAINRMEQIAWHLHRRGHSDDVIEGVLGGNFYGLFERVWGH